MKLIKSWIETQNKPFNSSILKVGEMMERDNGDVLLKMNNKLINHVKKRLFYKCL